MGAVKAELLPGCMLSAPVLFPTLVIHILIWRFIKSKFILLNTHQNAHDGCKCIARVGGVESGGENAW